MRRQQEKERKIEHKGNYMIRPRDKVLVGYIFDINNIVNYNDPTRFI